MSIGGMQTRVDVVRRRLAHHPRHGAARADCVGSVGAYMCWRADEPGLVTEDLRLWEQLGLEYDECNTYLSARDNRAAAKQIEGVCAASREAKF